MSIRGKLQCVHLCDKDTIFCVPGFESLERVPSMFVLMGSFQSFSCNAATTDYAGSEGQLHSPGAAHQRVHQDSGEAPEYLSLCATFECSRNCAAMNLEAYSSEDQIFTALQN